MNTNDNYTDDTYHRTWADGWYCYVHDAGFEAQEMECNDGDCPWCGHSVELDTDHEVAHQVAVIEETFVGTKDTGTAAVTDIKLPSGASVIHPEVAERLEREHGIQHLHKFGVYVAPDRCVETDTEQPHSSDKES